MENYEDFFDAAAKTPQTFNSFYIDTITSPSTRPASCRSATRTSIRACRPKGTGKYEWEGYLKQKDHPQGIDPEDGTMTNWNETVAHGFAAADENFGRNGSVMRVDLLDENLERLKGSDDKWSTWPR